MTEIKKFVRNKGVEQFDKRRNFALIISILFFSVPVFFFNHFNHDALAINIIMSITAFLLAIIGLILLLEGKSNLVAQLEHNVCFLSSFCISYVSGTSYLLHIFNCNLLLFFALLVINGLAITYILYKKNTVVEHSKDNTYKKGMTVGMASVVSLIASSLVNRSPDFALLVLAVIVIFTFDYILGKMIIPWIMQLYYVKKYNLENYLVPEEDKKNT